jgi:hypothetical protein
VWSGDAHLTMESEEFLKPKLVGGRFEGHAIPLDFLRDLVALNDIVLEGARAAYYKVNPDRKRLPNGFADEFTLSLSGVEPGSAIPKITLFFALLGGVPAQAVEFLHQSRENFVSGIRAAAEDGQPADYLTPKALTQFKNFGERLRDGEAIEFDDHGTPVRFTKEVRRKLLLSAPGVEEISEEVDLRGSVWRTDQKEKVFIIKLADGAEVSGPLAGDHYDNVMESAKDYRKGAKIHLQGLGIRNRQGKLLRIESIESSSVLEPLDIHARLEELRNLKQGWFDGEGAAFDPQQVDWLENSVRDHYVSGLPLPHIYPSPDGQIVFEWMINSRSASLEIDPGDTSGYWHVLDLTRRSDSTDEDLELGNAAGWKRLAELLASIREGEASDR